MIYVLSDVHGRGDRFRSILRQIRLKKTDHLYILGDVIDRNPDGIRLLGQILHADNMTLLLGNHEYMMLDFLAHPDDPDKAARWRERNGGEITWQRFLACKPAYRADLVARLHALPLNLSLTCGGRRWVLVHGAPASLAPFGAAAEPTFSRGSTAYYAVWHRITPEEPLLPGSTVVFGHTPTIHFQPGTPLRIFEGESRIGIDCGCAYPDGRLACLRLDDGKVFYSEDEGEG